MFREFITDRVWGISCLATAAIGTVTTYTLNHINLCCLILVSILTSALTTVKIIKEVRAINKEKSTLVKLAEENKEAIEKLKTSIDRNGNQ